MKLMEQNIIQRKYHHIERKLQSILVYIIDETVIKVELEYIWL
jgi:hypothetical protein